MPRKHVELVPRLLDYWRQRANQDPDFEAALAGLAAGIEHLGPVELDADAPTFSSGRTRYPDEESLSRVDRNLPRTLALEEDALIRTLGYTSAPVWDWSESVWANRGDQEPLTAEGHGR